MGMQWDEKTEAEVRESARREQARKEQKRKAEEYLDKEITFEEFLKDVEDMKAWISRAPRRRRSWFFSAYQWFEGSR